MRFAVVRVQFSGQKKGKRVAIAPVADGVRNKETAIAARLFTGFLLGRSPRKTPAMLDAAVAIGEHPPTDDKRKADPVFRYLATYGLYQMGATHWGNWWRPVMDAVVGSQRDDGNFAGSWDPLGRGVVRGGRLFSTALSVLTLESFYRYTRLVR